MRVTQAIIIIIMLVMVFYGAAEILSSGLSEMDALQDVALDLQDAQAHARAEALNVGRP